MNENTFSLDDLNELSKGLGDQICVLLDNHRNWFDYLRVKKQIEDLLSEHDLTPADIFVNRGLAEGSTIKIAFENAASNYQFQDQFND